MSDSREYFARGGEKLFILCDTMWAGLYNIPDLEWKAYLDYRRMQGFNAVQFNMLHQWDGGDSDLGLYPYERNEKGVYDYSKPNEEYFTHARKMFEYAHSLGFIPIIFALHASYIAGTWAVKGREEFIMPLDYVDAFAEKTAKTFLGLDPIYIAGADTDFSNDITYEYFRKMLSGIKKTDPDALCSFHLGTQIEGVPIDLPNEFANSPLYDYYTLQPGHDIRSFSNAYKLISDYYLNKPKKPIINDEFFYEGYSYTDENYGKYNEFDQRKAIWWALLSGAKAGIGYGAQGLWFWHNPDKPYLNIAHGGEAFTWQTALRFEGAWEASFAKHIVEKYDLFDVIPYTGILNKRKAEREMIRIARKPDDSAYFIYVPYSSSVKLDIDLSDYKITLVDMKSKRFGRLFAKKSEGGSIIPIYDINCDALIIAEK